jgi:Holliday junction resolvase RusA-like endonuclease
VSIKFVVLGEPASKANSRKLVRFGTRPAFIKSAKALSYTDSFKLQCPQLRQLLVGDIVVTIRVWYATRRPDLDVSIILDAMQGRIYANDRAVREQHLYWGLDRANPRAEITVDTRGPAVAAHDRERSERPRQRPQARRRRHLPAAA